MKIEVSKTYPKPNTSDDYRADARECADRAQRALEVAEVSLDTAVDLTNVTHRNGKPVLVSDLVALAAARVEIGKAWTALAAVRPDGPIDSGRSAPPNEETE